jgi:hypothetical protein
MKKLLQQKLHEQNFMRTVEIKIDIRFRFFLGGGGR